MATSSPAASDDELFQDAQGGSSRLPSAAASVDDQQDLEEASTPTAEHDAASTARETEGAHPEELATGDDTKRGAGPTEAGESTTAGTTTPPSSATKKQKQRMKKKKSRAALAASAAESTTSTTAIPAAPVPDSSASAYEESPAQSPAPSSPTIPASTAAEEEEAPPAESRRVPSPPPLLPPGARIGQAFANAQPFEQASPSKLETLLGYRGGQVEDNEYEPTSPRGTTSLQEMQDSPSRLGARSRVHSDNEQEEDDTLAELATASSVPTHLQRPFSLISEPDTPTTSSSSSVFRPTSPTSTFTHKSLSSHSHADPDQTTGGGQTSPSITGMARRSDLTMGGSSSAGSPSSSSALAGRELNYLGNGNGHGSGNGKALFADVSLGAGAGGEEEEGGDDDQFEEEDLNDEHGEGEDGEEEERAIGDPGTPTRSNGRRSTKSNGHRRAASEASSVGGGEGKYGFLRQRVEQQNTILESDPQAKRASVQGMSQIRESFARVREREAAAAAAHQASKDEIDWDFWGRVMSNYEEVASTNPRELSRAIQRGIPPALRGMTWQLMAATKDPQLEEMYSELLTQTSPHEKSIGRDLNRTFPKHEYFMDAAGVGQQNLFNVVKAYSIYDEEVGYTQGLQFIVGPLLLNMPDEEAFCTLVRLMKSYDLRSHYTPNMPGLQLRLFQFDRLLEELLPGVFMHLLRQGIKSSMYASQWFLTLFGYRFPLELVSSVFDLVFAEGVEAIFRFSVAILKRSEDKICQLEFEDLIEFLKNELYEVYAPDEDDESEVPLYKAQEFVREALQVKITPLMLDQFGEEWSTLCAQQSAHTLELDTLRKANSQLSSQVRQLEASLSQVNEEHCELVKQVVMAKLEREELEDELVKYKIAYADLSHQQASDGASFSRASMQSAQDREDRLSKGSSSSFWGSAMSRSSGSTGV